MSELINKPLISVVLPTINRATTLPRAIDSVLNQTYKNLELIIVDDGSTDGTHELLKQYQKKDKRIRVIFNKRNLGAALSRNKGIKVSKGTLIAFQDSDDEWKQNKLLFQANEIVNNNHVDIVYCNVDYYNLTNEIVGNTNVSIEGDDLYSKLLYQPIIPGTPTLLIKKKCLEAINGFDDVPSCQDYILTIKLASKHFYFKGINDSLVKVHLQANSISTNYPKMIRGRKKVIQMVQESNSSRHNKLKALSHHYWKIATYCLLNNSSGSKKYFRISFSKNLFNLKSLIFFLIASLSYSYAKEIYLFLDVKTGKSINKSRE